MYQFERWKESIEAARTPGDVDAVMAEYRSALAPGDKVGFSKASKYALLEGDIRVAAAALAREDLNAIGDPAVLEVMREVVLTFMAAAERMDALEQSK